MKVLMLGQQLELGHYRAEFLKSHGIQVIFPETKNAALAAILEGGFDSVIVTYTLSRETAKELVGLVKKAHPDCAVVGITQQRWGGDTPEWDDTVLDTEPPRALIEALIRVEKRRVERSRLQIRRVK